MNDFTKDANEEKDFTKGGDGSFLDGHEELLKAIQPEEEAPEDDVASLLDGLPTISSPVAADASDASGAEEADAEEASGEVEGGSPEAEESASEEDAADFLSALPSLDAAASAPAPQNAPAPAAKPSASNNKKKKGGKKANRKKKGGKKAKNRPAPKPQPQPAPKAEVPEKPKPQPKHDHHTERDPEEEARHRALLEAQRLKQSEVEEVLSIATRYAKPALAAVLVVSILALGGAFVKNRRIHKEQRAEMLLMNARNARNADALQAILDQYASTPAAPIALVELARIRFNAGRVDEADKLYREFLKKYADHDLRGQVELNLIACKEAKGAFAEAAEAYGQFAEKHPDSYLAPLALLAKGRSLESAGELEAARLAFEDVEANYPDTDWARTARQNMKFLLARLD